MITSISRRGMNWKRGVLVALPLMTMTASIVAPQARVEARTRKKGIAWHYSMQSAMKEAKRTGKPIMVDFYATWCGPCKMLDRDTFPNPKIVRESRNWVLLKIDAEKSLKLAEKYGVTGFPTVAFLQPNGKLVTGFVGYKPPRDALKSMKWARRKIARGVRISA